MQRKPKNLLCCMHSKTSTWQ